MKQVALLAVAAIAPLAMSTAASAQVKTASGTGNGLVWEAQSRIIGMTPTSTNTTGGGGDALFKPSANKSGVVSLIMDYGGGNRFICSGSLIDSRTILTAAHCVSDGAGTPGPLTTTAYFFTGNPDERTPFNATGIEVGGYFVNSAYTGQVIDQNDIAVLRLKSAAPDTAQTYGLYTGGLQGTEFNVAGYGTRSTIGGAFGGNAQTGFLREGDNNYDFRFGDSSFGGFWLQPNPNRPGSTNFFGTAEIEHSWLSDFDSGLAGNDTSCLISAAVGAPAGFACDNGLGAREVGVAGGDSGGPQFVNGMISSVTSYGLSFGTTFGDCRSGLNSSCGEFSGYVPVYLHENFIKSSMIPEPATWAMMIAGFGMVGAVARRRRTDIATTRA